MNKHVSHDVSHYSVHVVGTYISHAHVGYNVRIAGIATLIYFKHIFVLFYWKNLLLYSYCSVLLIASCVLNKMRTLRFSFLHQKIYTLLLLLCVNAISVVKDFRKTCGKFSCHGFHCSRLCCLQRQFLFGKFRTNFWSVFFKVQPTNSHCFFTVSIDNMVARLGHLDAQLSNLLTIKFDSSPVGCTPLS